METVIHPLKNLTFDNNIFIKRDDFYPFSFGGNKARKGALFFNTITNQKKNIVVTYGSSSSNHCRVISNMCYANGIKCYIVTPEKSSRTMNLELVEMANAIIVESKLENISQTIDNLIRQLENEGEKVYFIPGGGHGNIGTQAYVNCFEEIMAFEEREKIDFDYIFFASGTGTTQAGLICGSQINNKKKLKIIGISIARNKKRGTDVIRESIEEYLQKPYQDSIYFEDEWLLGGYGVKNTEIQNLVNEMYLLEGVPLDETYTGKAFLGMKKYIEREQLMNKNILFIHTGGTPLFFSDLEGK